MLSGLRPQDLARSLEAASPLVGGRYLHWDELGRLQPPDGSSHEAWRLSVWLGRAALLKPLPLVDESGVAFRLAMTEPALLHLHHIDRDAVGMPTAAEGSAVAERQDRLRLDVLIDEAIASSQLDGAAVSRRAAEDMLRRGRKPRGRAEMMIFNNYLAMEQVRALGDQPITPAGVLELHRILTEGTLQDEETAGCLRHGDTVAIETSGDIVLPRLPAARLLPARLQRLCAFANGDDGAERFVHPVVRAILLHFMVVRDRPFDEGNGRLARALFYWAMACSGYRLMEFLALSPVLRRARQQYEQACVYAATDGNDTTYFVLQQLDAIEGAMSTLRANLTRLTRQRRHAARLLAGLPELRGRINERQVALLAEALRNPGETYRVNTHGKLYQVVYETARTDLMELASLGLLEKRKRGRAFVFQPPTDLRARLDAMAGKSQSGPDA